MEIGDDLYNKHFRCMVQEGLICGLSHPVEWIVNYSRCIGQPYSIMPEIDVFIDLVSKDMFECIYCRAAKDNNEVSEWIRKYYEKEAIVIEKT